MQTNDGMMTVIVDYEIMVTDLNKHIETLQRLRQNEFQQIASLNLQLKESRRLNSVNGRPSMVDFRNGHVYFPWG